MKKVVRTRSAGRTRKKKVTLDVIFEKLNEITKRLDIIENGLRQIKNLAYSKGKREEKEPEVEFFMQR